MFKLLRVRRRYRRGDLVLWRGRVWPISGVNGDGVIVGGTVLLRFEEVRPVTTRLAPRLIPV